MTTAFRFTKPQNIPDPDEANLWSITSVDNHDAHEEFRFFICRKHEDGSITTYGQADSVFDALQLKKQLAAELGCLLFLKAKRRENPLVDFSDEQLERFRDWFAEGIGLFDVDRPLRAGYLAFCRTRGRSAR